MKSPPCAVDKSQRDSKTEKPGMVWNGMEDDFSIFHTGNFHPFHSKNLPFHIPFHTSIPR